MALEARASKTVRNKNLIIVLMCVVFLGWFAYDGWHTYPASDNGAVGKLRDNIERLDHDDQTVVQNWKGWDQETPENRAAMDTIIAKKRVAIEGWKSVTDIAMQRWIVAGLVIAVGASIGWLIHCQRRRAIADETTVSPSPGVVIPWDKIKIVDNSRWKSMGIVDIVYIDESGVEHRAKFDDYELEREPLLLILDQLSLKATHAEFLPREQSVPPAA